MKETPPSTCVASPPFPPSARCAGVWALVIASVLGPAVTARAHFGSVKYLVVERSAGGVHLDVAVEVVDTSVALGLGESRDESRLRGRTPDVQRWLLGGISLSGRGGACVGRPSPLSFTTRDGRRFIETQIDFGCPVPDAELRLRDDTVFDEDPQHEAFVRVRWSSDTDAAILRHTHREVRLGDPPSALGLMETFVVEGALHLATGYDHILFLLSLVLAAGLVAVRRGRRRALRDIALLVTSFTVGHSVTLFSAALGYVVLPSRLVESAIALSIMVVAALNISRPEARRAIPVLAFTFGLVHGFGFSSVLAQQGLPRGQQVLALVSFNVGIELAQLAFVAAVLAPLAWLARFDFYLPVVVRGGSGAILVTAGVWFVQRAFGG